MYNFSVELNVGNHELLCTQKMLVTKIDSGFGL